MHAMEIIMLSVLSTLYFFFISPNSRHEPLLHIQWQKKRKITFMFFWLAPDKVTFFIAECTQEEPVKTLFFKSDLKCFLSCVHDLRSGEKNRFGQDNLLKLLNIQSTFFLGETNDLFIFLGETNLNSLAAQAFRINERYYSSYEMDICSNIFPNKISFDYLHASTDSG